MTSAVKSNVTYAKMRRLPVNVKSAIEEGVRLAALTKPTGSALSATMLVDNRMRPTRQRSFRVQMDKAKTEFTTVTHG